MTPLSPWKNCSYFGVLLLLFNKGLYLGSYQIKPTKKKKKRQTAQDPDGESTNQEAISSLSWGDQASAFT